MLLFFILNCEIMILHNDNNNIVAAINQIAQGSNARSYSGIIKFLTGFTGAS